LPEYKRSISYIEMP